MPWAFVGFEAVSHSSAEFGFSFKKLWRVLNADRQGYDIVQMALLVFSLVIMFSLYATQRRREEVLEVAQAKAEARDRAKSAFLSTISHDIRTPMNAIIGYIELAKRQGVPEATLREYISKMESSSHHLLALITDVLEMSRIESGKIELEPVPVDLVAVFDELADLFAAQMDEKDLDFRIDVARVSHRRVMCDRSRLNRILLNLVGNAWKFTPAGGRITATLVENPSTKDGEGFYELRDILETLNSKTEGTCDEGIRRLQGAARGRRGNRPRDRREHRQ